MKIQYLRKPVFALAIILSFMTLFNCQDRKTNLTTLLPPVTRQSLTSRTYLFSRAQYKYSLGNPNYLHRWSDRPLFIDKTLDQGKAQAAQMSSQSFLRMQQVVKQYGLDGLAFFPETSGRMLISQYSKDSDISGFHSLYEFVNTTDLEAKAAVVEAAIADPNSFRINGRVVITSYRADGLNFFWWEKTLKELRQKYGSKFIFLPDISNFASKSLNVWIKKFETNTLTSKDISDIKAYLRGWLSISDGLYFASVAMCRTADGNFHPDFYENFVVAIMKSVLAEPQNKDKYFGLSAVVGHENTTRLGFTLSEDGTKTLRKSLQIALDAKPELINIPEWDEENENTSLRPTVYNGLSSMRIVRYLSKTTSGVNLTPIQGENSKLPDLIVSTRKTINLGEKLQIELLNIPASNNKFGKYNVQFKLNDLSDKTVYTSEEYLFSDDKMEDFTVELPSENYAKYPALIPEVVIRKESGETINVNQGFHYIELRPTSNWDYKWVKQPIRDLLQPSKAQITVGDTDEEGIKMITVNVKAPEPLAYVEVLDNDDVSFSYDPQDPRLSHNFEKFRIAWKGMGSMSSAQILKGAITINGADAKWILPTNSLFQANRFKGNKFNMEGLKAFTRPQWVDVLIPKNQILKANLSLNLPGLTQKQLSLTDLLDKEIFGIPGNRGLNIVVSRSYLQDEIPLPLHDTEMDFQMSIRPRSSNSLITLQLIGVSGREYRSTPIAIQTTQVVNQHPIIVYSDSQQKPVSVLMDEDRIPNIRYTNINDHGSVLVPTSRALPYRAILGGYFALATFTGGAAGNDDIPFINPSDYPTSAPASAPNLKQISSNEYALEFDGKGTFISLPQCVIPYRAAYTLSMDIWPENYITSQIIVANSGSSPGSITVYLNAGEVCLAYRGKNTNLKTKGTGIFLKNNVWSHLEIIYDLENIVVSINGHKINPIKAQGPGLYTTPTSIGGFGNMWFKGRIKNIQIVHSIAEK